jgi:hypothetical protein
MIARPDVLIQNENRQTVGVVEFKNRENLTVNLATEYRECNACMHERMVAHRLLRNVPYFLLLSQDSGFLWTKTQKERADAPPAHRLNMRKVIDRYLPSVKLRRSRMLSEVELESVLLPWLYELTTMSKRKELEEPECARMGRAKMFVVTKK